MSARLCQTCQTDISALHHLSKRCLGCQAEKVKADARERQRAWYAKNRERKCSDMRARYAASERHRQAVANRQNREVLTPEQKQEQARKKRKAHYEKRMAWFRAHPVAYRRWRDTRNRQRKAWLDRNPAKRAAYREQQQAARVSA